MEGKRTMIKPRPIDHLVLPVLSLAVARSRFENLGFQVQPDRQHPFGTQNCCIMFSNRTYLEPLAPGNRDDAEQAIVEGNVFVRRQDAFRFRHDEGFAMLALKTSDADTAHDEFTRLGYAAGQPFAFDRSAIGPDGSEARIGVRLAYAEDHRSPDALLFACQHLSPEIVWTDSNVVHSNGASGVRAVYLSEPNPSDFQYYLETVCGQRSIRASSAGIEADTGGGVVSILTPDAMRAMFGIGLDHHGRGLRLRGMQIVVGSRGALVEILQDNGIDYRQHDSRVIVDPAPGQGAFIVFEEDLS